MAIRKRVYVIALCVVLAAGLFTGIGILLWRQHVDEENDDNDNEPALSDRLKLDLGDSNIQLKLLQNAKGSATVLNGFLANNKNTSGVKECKLQGNGKGLCFKWDLGPRVEIFEKPTGQLKRVTDFQCFTVNWVMDEDKTSLETPEDCYDMSNHYWYGGFEESNQFWPMNENDLVSLPYVTGDAFVSDRYGNVIEPLFLSSSGVGIYVDETTPLYLSINDTGSKQMCIKGKVGSDTPFFHRGTPFLRYDVCKTNDIANLWKGMAELYLPKPKSYPSLDVIRHPIWTTWAAYKGNINESVVLSFAEEITQNNFSISQLEVDDDWTPHYGDFIFTTDRFPNAKEMIVNLTQMGIPVTVWVHWFFNNDSDAFTELSKAGYLIKEFDSDKPLLVKWWRGDFGAILDFTNSDAVGWYIQNVNNLTKTYNVTSFKFDAGEISWLGKSRYKLKNELETPNYLTKKYSEATFDGDTKFRRQELRVGFRSQASAVMIRMLDRDSNWSHKLGIKTLIPCALAFGMMGYPFVLPDMIGGNAYDPSDIDITVLPKKELYIRWLQASVFMPVLQFSVVPWHYDVEVVRITRKFVNLHAEYTDKIGNLAIHAQKTGEPIIRPLWWIAPHDEEALAVDTEFLLGDDLLVAPVLDKGATSRDIYLPAGLWWDVLNSQTQTGGKWLKNYHAALDELPYFSKLA